MPAFREGAVCDEKLSEVTHAHLNLVCKRTGKQRPVAKTDFVGNVISLASDERKKHFLGKTYNFDFHIADTQNLESQLLSVLAVSHWPLWTL